MEAGQQKGTHPPPGPPRSRHPPPAPSPSRWAGPEGDQHSHGGVAESRDRLPEELHGESNQPWQGKVTQKAGRPGKTEL